MKVASPPAARTSAAVSSPASSPYSATTTRAPSAANIWAATRPMPPPAPVMIVTLSCSRMALPLTPRHAQGTARTRPVAPVSSGTPARWIPGWAPASIASTISAAAARRRRSFGVSGLEHGRQRGDPPVAPGQQERTTGRARTRPGRRDDPSRPGVARRARPRPCRPRGGSSSVGSRPRPPPTSRSSAATEHEHGQGGQSGRRDATRPGLPGRVVAAGAGSPNGIAPRVPRRGLRDVSWGVY